MENKLVERKRKTPEIPHKKIIRNDELRLSLSSSSPSHTPPSSMQLRRVSSATRSRSEGGGGRSILKTDKIPPPFPWATETRATVHSMEYLVNQGINTITGDVQCKKCEKTFEMQLNVQEKFRELVYFLINEGDMRQRAPEEWLEPTLPRCVHCGHADSCKPLIAEKKRNINWLFLLLTQLVGCCTLEQLKWFCKYTHNHRTGAKDRVLFLSYFALCKQLDPNCPFNF